VIVLALAGRGQDALTGQALNQLFHWWNRRESHEIDRKRFVQTTRLALLNLSLRICGNPQAAPIQSEVEKVLIARLLPSRMWGDYWTSDASHDNTPRPLSDCDQPPLNQSLSPKPIAKRGFGYRRSITR
jgi:hypothetical protein